LQRLFQARTLEILNFLDFVCEKMEDMSCISVVRGKW